MALAHRENAMNAIKAFSNRSKFVIWSAKNSGKNIKVFFIYWCGRVNNRKVFIVIAKAGSWERREMRPAVC